MTNRTIIAAAFCAVHALGAPALANDDAAPDEFTLYSNLRDALSAARENCDAFIAQASGEAECIDVLESAMEALAKYQVFTMDGTVNPNAMLMVGDHENPVVLRGSQISEARVNNQVFATLRHYGQTVELSPSDDMREAVVRADEVIKHMINLTKAEGGEIAYETFKVGEIVTDLATNLRNPSPQIEDQGRGTSGGIIGDIQIGEPD